MIRLICLFAGVPTCLTVFELHLYDTVCLYGSLSLFLIGSFCFRK